jgi:hypothetical protein
MLVRILIVLADRHLRRHRFQLRRFGLEFLGLPLRGCGWFRFLPGILVVTPERGLCEVAVVRLVFLIFAGARSSLGNG